MKTRLFLLLVMAASLLCCKARDLASTQTYERNVVIEFLSNNELSKEESRHAETVDNDQLCLVCEEFASEALNYLSENKTQTEIRGVFHKYCSSLPSFKQQCILLVDYYGDLFFNTLGSVQPGEFCRKFGLCEGGSFISSRISKDKCEICHDFVTEALLKLKDPDTELEIVKLLLKACDSVGKTAAKCKKLVFEYTPLILVNAEQFLEKNDICTVLHACDSSGARRVPVLEKVLFFLMQHDS